MKIEKIKELFEKKQVRGKERRNEGRDLFPGCKLSFIKHDIRSFKIMLLKRFSVKIVA